MKERRFGFSEIWCSSPSMCMQGCCVAILSASLPYLHQSLSRSLIFCQISKQRDYCEKNIRTLLHVSVFAHNVLKRKLRSRATVLPSPCPRHTQAHPSFRRVNWRTTWRNRGGCSDLAGVLRGRDTLRTDVRKRHNNARKKSNRGLRNDARTVRDTWTLPDTFRTLVATQ